MGMAVIMVVVAMVMVVVAVVMIVLVGLCEHGMAGESADEQRDARSRHMKNDSVFIRLPGTNGTISTSTRYLVGSLRV